MGRATTRTNWISLPFFHVPLISYITKKTKNKQRIYTYSSLSISLFPKKERPSFCFRFFFFVFNFPVLLVKKLNVRTLVMLMVAVVTKNCWVIHIFKRCLWQQQWWWCWVALKIKAVGKNGAGSGTTEHNKRLISLLCTYHDNNKWYMARR